jgi:hypothetical protein
MMMEENAMSTSMPSDSEAFYDYLGQSLNHGGRETPPEELMRKWRAEREFEEACEDIRQGMADIQAGLGVPLQEVADAIRRKHGLAKA